LKQNGLTINVLQGERHRDGHRHRLGVNDTVQHSGACQAPSKASPAPGGDLRSTTSPRHDLRRVYSVASDPEPQFEQSRLDPRALRRPRRPKRHITNSGTISAPADAVIRTGDDRQFGDDYLALRASHRTTANIVNTLTGTIFGNTYAIWQAPAQRCKCGQHHQQHDRITAGTSVDIIIGKIDAPPMRSSRDQRADHKLGAINARSEASPPHHGDIINTSPDDLWQCLRLYGRHRLT